MGRERETGEGNWQTQIAIYRKTIFVLETFSSIFISKENCTLIWSLVTCDKGKRFFN